MPEAASIAYRVSHGGGSDSGPPPLVFIHGAGGSSLHWPPHLRRLHGLDVYAIDLPGHGESSGTSADTIVKKAQAVIAWKEALELGSCVFAGHSMGGAIALTLSLDHSEHVAGLILVGTGGRLRVHPDILTLTASEDTFPQAVAAIGSWAFSEQADDGLVELAGKRLLETPHQAVHADFVACNHFDVLSRLSEIHTPTQVICGDKDQLTPPKYSQHLVDQIPDASLTIIEGAGHMVMLEKPEAITSSILDFINTLT